MRQDRLNVDLLARPRHHEQRRNLAEVHVRNGLGLYFWLRLGYRPARPDEVFWRAPDEDGIIAMVREAS